MRPLPVFDGTLASIAPRLAKARDDLLVERRAAMIRRRVLRESVLKRERLVAHRELQVVRAATARSRTAGAYFAERMRKLEKARAELAHFQRELRRAEAA